MALWQASVKPEERQAFLKIAIEAVAMASDLAVRVSPGAVSRKGDRDMVSELDVAIERRVREFLREATPDIPFLGEEEGNGGLPGNDPAERSGLLWALDPIDGTANLIHGLPLCAISLGLVFGNIPVVGVVDLPFLGTRYWASEGDGAYCNNGKLASSRTETLAEAIVATGDYAVGKNAGPKNSVRLALTSALASKVQRVRMLGSAATDLVWVAEGKLDACIILSNKPWDTAAGVLIAREAGALVVDAEGATHSLDSATTVAVGNRDLASHLMRLLEEVQ